MRKTAVTLPSSLLRALGLMARRGAGRAALNRAARVALGQELPRINPAVRVALERASAQQMAARRMLIRPRPPAIPGQTPSNPLFFHSPSPEAIQARMQAVGAGRTPQQRGMASTVRARSVQGPIVPTAPTVSPRTRAMVVPAPTPAAVPPPAHEQAMALGWRPNQLSAATPELAQTLGIPQAAGPTALDVLPQTAFTAASPRAAIETGFPFAGPFPAGFDPFGPLSKMSFKKMGFAKYAALIQQLAFLEKLRLAVG